MYCFFTIRVAQAIAAEIRCWLINALRAVDQSNRVG